MKHPFVKSAVTVVAIAAALMSCSEDPVTTLPNLDMGTVPGTPNNPSIGNPDGLPTTTEPCWRLDADQTYLITTAGVVTDINGNMVGTFDATTGSITSVTGATMFESVDLNALPILEANQVIEPIQPSVIPDNGNSGIQDATSSASVIVPTSSTTNQPVISSPNDIGTTSSSDAVTAKSSSSKTNVASSSSKQVQSSSSAAPQPNNDGSCFDKNSNKNVQPYTELVGKNGEKYAYKNDCSIDCWWDGSNSNCANIFGSGSNNNNNTQQPKSSSSQQQQQQAKSSSSQTQQGGNGGASLLPKIIGNEVKSGYATRYWDSCKPHCAWEGKGGPVARTCNADGISKASSDAASVCDNGNAGTCFDQTPQIVNDTIAYAFAATPGGGNDCGKCYMLTFKGTGASATNTPTDSHHRAIKGKHLIVMASNIGYDVSHNQFDLMIPGGGPGAFNGCGKMGISCAGAQYGGFLTTCNYKKDCLIKMCNSEYSNESLRNGCLFLANWMDAANNPEMEFVQVECPAALAAKY